MRQDLVSRAQRHWKKWLPQKVADLRAEGAFESATQAAAQMAQDEISRLMKQGYQQHEAEEVVLPQFILLKPEPDAGMSPAMRKELAQKEADYQKMMRDWLR